MNNAYHPGLNGALLYKQNQFSMNLKQLSAWCIVAVLSFGTFTACKSKNNDQDIQASVSEKLPVGITATVQEGVVTLSGACPDANCKTTAEQAAKDVKGVESVTNNISVSVVGNAPVEIATDDALTNSVNAAISEYPTVKANVANGVVTLTGSINRSELQELMQKVQALNPQRVENQLTVNN